MQLNVDGEDAISSLLSSRSAINRPPTTFHEQRRLRTAIRTDNQHKNYLQNLRQAFFEADPEETGKLNIEQWKHSTIHFLLGDGDLSFDDFEQYFYRIDATSKKYIDWNDLCQFIIQEITNTELQTNEEVFQPLCKLTPSTNVISHSHRDSMSQILSSPWTSEYITVSKDSIRFWKQNPLSFSRTLNISGPFSVSCAFQKFPYLAVATTTRHLYFFQLPQLQLVPCEISASPSTQSIRKMETQESRQTLKSLRSGTQPLFNIPTTMIEATLNSTVGKNELLFLVGDDCGGIDFYSLSLPKRRGGTDYSISRLFRSCVHKGQITQISVIDILGRYATSSTDFCVKFFIIAGQEIQVTHLFEGISPVVSFAFISTQRLLAICSSGHDAFVWSTNPPHRSIRISVHYNPEILVSEFVTQSGTRLLVSLTARKEIHIWDGSNFTLKGEIIDGDFVPPDNRFTTIFFDPTRHILLTGSTYPILLSESKTEIEHGITHKTHIISIDHMPDFDQLLTVDGNGEVCIWKYSTGECQSIRHIFVNEISQATLDYSGRCLITSTYHGEISLWNPHSGKIIFSPPQVDDTPITVLSSFTHNSRSFISAAGWSKNVYLYRENTIGVFELLRKLPGHHQDICSFAFDPSGYFCTGSVGGELFCWSLDTSTPRQTTTPNLSPVEQFCLHFHYLFVSDSDGYVTVFTVPHLQQVFHQKAHLERVSYSLSAICVHEQTQHCLTGDSLGYIRQWKLKLSPIFCMDGGEQVRAHEGEVERISLSKDNFIITCGSDLAVRLWTMKGLTCVGTFGLTTWNLFNEGTWTKTSPIQQESSHFHMQTLALNGKDPLQRRSGISLLSKSSYEGSIQATTRSIRTNRHKQQEQPETEAALEFNWDKARELMQQFSIESSEPKHHIFHETEYDEGVLPKKTNLMSLPIKSELEVRDMITKINNLRATKPIERVIDDKFHHFK